MATLSNFTPIMPLAIPLLPGVPEPVIEFCLRQSSIEICERTRCWRETIDTAATSATVIFPIPPSAEIFEVEAMFWNGAKLTAAAYLDSPASVSSRSGNPTTFTQQSADGAFILDPFEDEGDVRAILYLKPRQGQLIGFDESGVFVDAYNYVPAFMIQQHSKAMVYGAVALACDMPESGAADPMRAQDYRRRFEEQIGAAQTASLRGQQRAPIRTKPQWM